MTDKQWFSSIAADRICLIIMVVSGFVASQARQEDILFWVSIGAFVVAVLCYAAESLTFIYLTKRRMEQDRVRLDNVLAAAGLRKTPAEEALDAWNADLDRNG